MRVSAASRRWRGIPEATQEQVLRPDGDGGRATSPSLPGAPKNLPFLMPVEDVFTIKGRGTVVTGRVSSAAQVNDGQR